MKSKFTIIPILIILIGSIFLHLHYKKSSISPPPTAEELSFFRIVTNQFGVMAIQQREGTNWLLRANRWRDEKGCRWDMEWWIAHTIRVNTNVNTQEMQSVWKPR